jgi:hypothetical protein
VASLLLGSMCMEWPTLMSFADVSLPGHKLVDTFFSGPSVPQRVESGSSYCPPHNMCTHSLMVAENKKQDTQHIAFQRLPAARACIFPDAW